MEQITFIQGALPEWVRYSGYGYGDGDGSDYGDGSGSGDGDGSGYGDGSGSGYGYGSGYGSEEYWQSTILYFSRKWPEAYQTRLSELEQRGAVIAFWRSDAEGYASNGGARNSRPATPGLVEVVEGPLQICTSNALHATLVPPKWNGERWWIVAMIGEIQRRDDKIGALQREIIGECL